MRQVKFGGTQATDKERRRPRAAHPGAGHHTSSPASSTSSHWLIRDHSCPGLGCQERQCQPPNRRREGSAASSNRLKTRLIPFRLCYRPRYQPKIGDQRSLAYFSLWSFLRMMTDLLQATLPAQNRRPKIAGLLQSLVLPANDDGSVATHRPSAGSRVGGAGGGSPSGPPGKGVPDTRNGSPGRGGEWWSLAHAGEPSPGYR